MLFCWQAIFAVFLLICNAWGRAIPDESRSLPDHLGRLDDRALSQFVNLPASSDDRIDLERAFRDMATMLHLIFYVWDNQNNPRLCTETDHVYRVLSKYFPSDGWDTVMTVLRRLISPATIDPATGSDILGHVVIDGNDFWNKCRSGSASSTVLAYTDFGYDRSTNTWVRSYSRIHFCPSGLDSYHSLGYYSCPGSRSAHYLDRYVSYRMLSRASLLLHEMIHTQEISKNIYVPGLGTQMHIYDVEITSTGFLFAGPQSVVRLRDDSGTKYYAVANAPNYEWFVAELYWSLVCDYEFDDARDDYRVP